MTADPAPLPLALVTGFLGSGKTTFLERVAARNRGRRLVFLVNEFSSRDVDGERLRGKDVDVVTVAGGSLFCRCVVTELLYHLKGLPERFGAPGSPVEGVIVETSGIADPSAAGPLLRETGLDARYRIASVVALVDPGSLPRVLEALPAARSQIEAASVVLLNKTDLAAPDAVDAAERQVRAIAPGARILRTVRADADLDLGAGAPAPPPRAGALSDCADPRIARLRLRFTAPTDPADLGRRLAALGDDVLRAKGFLPAVDGRFRYLDLSTAGLAIGEPAAVDAVPEIALVVRGPAHDRVRDALAGMPGAAIASDAPSGGTGDIA